MTTRVAGPRELSGYSGTSWAPTPCPFGRKQRKAFVKEVILGPQSERIFREFFEHVGPSKIQYKSVADQGDETIFLYAIPQPKVSQAQAEAWQLGGCWRKPSKVSQVGREGAIDAGRQTEIDELWARQKLLRERLEKIDLPLAELTRQLADSTQPGTDADETWSMCDKRYCGEMETAAWVRQSWYIECEITFLNRYT
jgi:hypothetical protein